MSDRRYRQPGYRTKQTSRKFRISKDDVIAEVVTINKQLKFP